MRSPTQAQIFHRERGFQMKGRVAAIYSNIQVMLHSDYLTLKEKEDLACAQGIIGEIMTRFDTNTRILKLKRFAK
jgi:hypothetical protein